MDSKRPLWMAWWGTAAFSLILTLWPFLVRAYRAPQEEYARQQGLRGTAMPEVINYSYGAREPLRWPLNDTLWTPWIRAYPPGRTIRCNAPGWREFQFRLDGGSTKTIRIDSDNDSLGVLPSNEFRVRGLSGMFEMHIE